MKSRLARRARVRFICLVSFLLLNSSLALTQAQDQAIPALTRDPEILARLDDAAPNAHHAEAAYYSEKIFDVNGNFYRDDVEGALWGSDESGEPQRLDDARTTDGGFEFIHVAGTDPIADEKGRVRISRVHGVDAGGLAALDRKGLRVVSPRVRSFRRRNRATCSELQPPDPEWIHSGFRQLAVDARIPGRT
ncbi:MAG: hypothetical protein IT350_12315 [Deltaproteobacteria bacterium]|nr:hypothetical protein [Deltaproteobacteria bacterium]